MFCVKYFRALCVRHGVPINRDEPLHSVFGKYVKYVEASGRVEAKVSIRILNTAITILDDLNDARNNKSFAHDNQMLNYHEARLIFSNITSTIKFAEHLEGVPAADRAHTAGTPLDDDIPF